MKKYVEDFHVLQEMIRRFINHNITASGAQMAYFLLMMIFPFIMFLIAVLGYLNIPVDDTLYFLSSVAPKEVMQIISKYVEYLLTEKKGDLIFVAVIASFWTASNSLNALTNSLNMAYGIEETRSYTKKKLLVIPFTIMALLCISIALTIPILGKEVLIWVSRFINISYILIEYLRYLRWIVAVFTLFNVIIILYYIAPNTRVKYFEIVPGAIFATFGWICISTIISLYFNSMRGYEIIYGSIGAVIVLLIWLFWGAMIIIMGGELNAILKEMRLFKTSRKKKIWGKIDKTYIF